MTSTLFSQIAIGVLMRKRFAFSLWDDATTHFRTRHGPGDGGSARRAVQYERVRHER
jgi:hypothetical protein|tara:strand:- start:1967 stop:2137 length:171 start_codon:yes stop_codon:yes gene_type:complete